MANVRMRLDAPRRGPSLRMAALVIVLLGLIICGSYLLYVPLLQVYWGAYARLRPMVSSVDVMGSDGEVIDAAAGGSDVKVRDPAPAAVTAKADEAAAAAKAEEAAAKAAAKEEAAAAAAAKAAAEKEKEQDKEKKAAAAEKAKEKEKAAAAKAAVKKAAKEEAGSVLAKAHALTKEMVESVAKGQVVVVTWANYHYRDFVLNWVEHLKATGCTSYLVGAMDDKLLEVLAAAGVNTFAMSSGLSTSDFGWGSATFHKMGREKISLIQTFTRMGQDVIISDVDTVWTRNPVEYVAKFPSADVLTSSDQLSATTTDEGLERWPDAGSAANIGIMLFRVKAAELADEWVQVLDADDKMWDQNAFNDLFRRGANFTAPAPDAAGEERLFAGYDGKLQIGILPVSLFCSGHTFFTQGMPAKHGLAPYVAHATFQFSGTPGKRNRFRERLLWSDPPEYFQPEPGFVSVKPPPLQELLEAARGVEKTGTLAATLPHFALVNAQLSHIRALLGLATALGRAAVLPEMWCGQDRWWAPHSGVIPGSDLELPFLCPADHVMDLEGMEVQDRVDSLGPYIPWREYSFLQNPRAAALASSTLTVATCDAADDADCADGGDGKAPIQGGVVRLKPGLSGEAIAAALGGLGRHAVLHFEDAAALFGGFDDAERAERFKRRMDIAVSIWCCVDAHPGHIWYDLSWDQVPHTDRHGREVAGEWEPITGP